MKKKLQKLLICLGSIAVILISIYFMLSYIVFRQFFKDKYSFTDTEISIIAEKIDIDSEELQSIKRMRHAHGRDNVYIIYSILNSNESLEKNYQFTSSDKTVKIYINKNDYNIFCELTENDSSYNAMFYIDAYEYDKSFHDIME
ncbi:MAG: hypothetical protein K2H89_06300 [Oscillospiraceae bacterium]|nr:hypothetical protein [Oscillospiraceae bacterium]